MPLLPHDSCLDSDLPERVQPGEPREVDLSVALGACPLCSTWSRFTRIGMTRQAYVVDAVEDGAEIGAVSLVERTVGLASDWRCSSCSGTVRGRLVEDRSASVDDVRTRMTERFETSRPDLITFSLRTR